MNAASPSTGDRAGDATWESSSVPGFLNRHIVPATSLAHRELIRFFRQPTRIIGAVGQPILFWILFGSGLHGSFQAPAWAASHAANMTFHEYFFPGILVLIVLFTAIFSTISIIEDRAEGFLQGVLAAPVPRSAIVLGKLGGGSALAMLQSGLFLVIGPLLSWLQLVPEMSFTLSWSCVPATLLFLLLLSFQLTALGFLIAWPMNSTQGFHAIMSIFLMPMWLLSGSFFPGGDSGIVYWVIRLNPLTYGVAGLRHCLYCDADLTGSGGLPGFSTCVAVTLGTCTVYMGLCIVLTHWRIVRDSR